MQLTLPRALFVLTAVVLLLSPATAWAQRTTGTLGGTVQDGTGALVPGADVTVINEGTGVSRTTITSDTGTFVVQSLQPGSYTLTVEMPGFRTYEQTSIVLESARDLREFYTLQIGEVTETVTVEGGQTLVSTVGSEQRGGLTSEQIHTLPNPNRNITNLLVLSPAVTITSGHRAVRLNGMGRHASSYTMDGIEASGSTEGNLMSQYSGTNRVDLISIEGVQEVQVVKGVVPAEYGNTVSGQINVISKSGTNEIHGTVFHLYQTEELNGRDPFLGGRETPLVYNQFGGSVGFPIIKDNLGIVSQAFGFFAYEGYEERRNRRRRADVPTQLARDEMLASPAFDDREKQILNVIFNEEPFPTDPTTIDPRGLGGEFDVVRGQVAEDDTFLWKGDVHFSDGSQLSGTWNRLDPSFQRPSYIPIDDRTWLDNSNRIALSYFKSTSNWNFESRVGWTKVDQFRVDRNFVELRDPTSPETFPFGHRLPGLDTGVWGTAQGEVWTADSTTYNLDQKLGYIKGNHAIKFGGVYRLKTGNRTNPEMPDFNFGSHDEALANQIERITYTFGRPVHDARIFQFGFFFQDDWKVTPNLTLNFGFRWDWMSNFTVGPRCKTESCDGDGETGRNADLTFLNLEPPTDWAKFDFGRPIVPTQAIRHDKVNVAPRFGFNWDVTGAGETVIKGGVGMMFAPIVLGVHRDAIQFLFVPRRSRFSASEIAERGFRLGTLNQEAAASIIERTSGAGFNPIPFSLYNPFYEAPYTLTYTLGFQHELVEDTVLEVDYVGQRGVKLPMFRPVNQPTRLDGSRINPDLVGVSFYIDESQQSFYNAMQVALRKRFSNRLSYGVSYAYGRSLATSGADTGHRFGSDNAACCQEFDNPLLERGRIPGDIEHNFSTNWYYQLPSPADGALRGVLGDWSITGIFRAQPGGPIDIDQRRTGGRGLQRADYVGGGNFLDCRNDDYRSTLQFWDTSCFAAVPRNDEGVPIRPGNTSRSFIDGPEFWSVDLSFGKDFLVTEEVRVRFRWDWINAFNHVNLGNPRDDVDRSRFGQIRGRGGSMRVTQLNLRLEF